MDTIYMIVIIVVHLNCLAYGDEKDPTDCKGGPKYETCETTTEDDIVPTTSEKIITTHKEAKLSSLAISIAIPVVVVVLIAVTLVIFLLRCKRKISKQPVKLRDKLTGPTITNKSYDVESQKKSYVQTLQSQESQYHHIQMNNVDTKEGSGNVYQTIDASPDDRGIRNDNYYHLDSVANLIVKDTYSHISVISSNGSHLDDLTYSHTHNLYLSPEINENTQDAYDDDSYNKLGSTTRRSYIHNKPNEIIDDETDYNHTLLKPSRRTDETETYSHLTTS